MSGRCPSCGGYEWYNGVCKVCGYMPKTIKPRFELGNIDLNKLHTLAIEQVKTKIKHSIPRLSECLYCHYEKHTLFYDSTNDQFECFRPECAIHNKPVLFNTKEYADIINSLKLKHFIEPIELTELEYDIYKNKLHNPAEGYSFEVIIKY